MKELFNQQLEFANPYTQELLDEVPTKNYSSGEEKHAGDIPLWGLKVIFSESNETENLSLDLFSLCEREFPYYADQFTVLPNPLTPQYTIPIFIKKGEEEKYESMKNNHLN